MTSSTSAIDQFTYIAPVTPVVNGIGPNHGSANGGTNVTIFGSGLSGVGSVAFGTNSISACPTVAPQRPRLVRMAPKRMLAAGTSPLGSGGGGGSGCFSPSGSDTVLNLPAPPGTASSTPVDVVVTTGAGASTASSADKYTYDTPGPPEVDAIDPNHGTALGGTTVTVFGQGFTGATTVDFGATKLPSCSPQTQSGPCFNQNDDGHIFISQSPPGTANTSVDIKVEVGPRLVLLVPRTGTPSTRPRSPSSTRSIPTMDRRAGGPASTCTAPAFRERPTSRSVRPTLARARRRADRAASTRPATPASS